MMIIVDYLRWTTASWRARLPTSSPKLASQIC